MTPITDGNRTEVFQSIVRAHGGIAFRTPAQIKDDNARGGLPKWNEFFATEADREAWFNAEIRRNGGLSGVRMDSSSVHFTRDTGTGGWKYTPMGTAG